MMDRGGSAGRRRLLSLVLAAAALAILGVMASLTLPATDDYQYRLFLRDGLENFIEMNREHYETYNGRVFVHVCAQLVLWLGGWSFTAVCLACCAAIPVCVILAGRRREDLPVGLAIFAAGALALPYPVINQGILWVSSFFNYTFPTALICVTLTLLAGAEASERPGPWRILGLAVLSFACGASNEQSSLLAIALTGWFAVKALRKGRGRLVAAVSFAAALEGFCTVLLSPATSERAMVETVETSDSLLERISSAARSELGFMAGNTTHGILLACFFLLAGAALAGRLRDRRTWLPAAVCAAAALISGFFSGTAVTVLTGVMLVALALWAAAVIWSGREVPGLLVLLGLLSLAVVLPTESRGSRLVTPYYLYLLAAVAALAAQRLRGREAAAFQAAVFCLGLLGAVPFIGGMIDNYKVDLENRENIAGARETGTLMYRLDYDYTYTHQKVSLDVWRDYFLEGEGLPEDTVMRFYSTERPNVLVDGEPWYPVVRLEDGTDLIAAQVVREFGGGTFYGEELKAVAIAVPWQRCTAQIASDGRTAVVRWTDGGGTERELETVYRSNDWLNWFPAEVYTDVLGLEVTFDGAKNAYIVSAPEDRTTSEGAAEN